MGGSVQIRTELGESSEFSVLGEGVLQRTSESLHGLDLSGRTDSGDGKTDVNGRSDTLVEKFGFQENLTIGNGNNVGGNISGDITSLGFDDGQGSQRTSTVGSVHLSGSFQETRMQIENITRVSFSTGGSSQQQRHLSVSDGLLGKIVVDNQSVLAVISEVFTNSATRVRSQELKGSSIGSGSANEDGEFHAVVLLEDGDQVSNGGSLLADGDVDAI